MQAGSLDPQGPVAEAMADLWWLMVGLGTVVFAIFAVLLGMALFRRPTTDGVADSRFGRWFVGWGVVGPLVVLVVVFGATVYAMRVIPRVEPSDALVVEIVGNQWFYEVEYPDQGITATDEVHIPVGRPVAFRLTSADVIHSFWVPALGGKRDMLPDGVNTLVLQADVPGEHVSRCAEFCGLRHADMELIVVAEPEQQFEAWVAEQRRAAAEPAQDTAGRGRGAPASTGGAG